MEQASGPAVKMAGTLQQEESFSPQSWLTRQQEYLEKDRSAPLHPGV